MAKNILVVQWVKNCLTVLVAISFSVSTLLSYAFISAFVCRTASCSWQETESIFDLPTVWSRVIFEKLRVLQLVNKFPHFPEPRVSLPRSERPATCYCPKPD